MANREHVERLKQGVEVWNRWREENPDVVPDLSEANLLNADLRGANLSKANLREANLCIANLSYANFFEADLRRANLRKVELEEANLARADLSGADFVLANIKHAEFFSANLHGVNFIESNITRARFHWSNLDKAIFGFTVLSNILFKETKCLETTIHKGPSTLGIDTFYLSHLSISEAFLRGCGVPDQMIEYAKSLAGSPFKFYSCFISYSSKNEEFAKRLHADLQAKGVRCWLACEDMKIGNKIRSTIEESIRLHDKLLLIFSKHSVKSKWVKHEVENALDLEIEREKTVLFPVRVDDAVMDSEAGWANEIKKTRHIGGFHPVEGSRCVFEGFRAVVEGFEGGVGGLYT